MTINTRNCRRRLAREFLVFFAFFLAASITLDLQVRSWGPPQGNERFDLVHLLDGTAEKPWAFRVLVPFIVRNAHANLPDSVRDALSNDRIVMKVKERYWGQPTDGSEIPIQAEKYVLLVLLVFSAYMGLLYLLRALTTEMVGTSSPFASFAPVGFALFLPLTFVNGAYFYDSFELLFIAAFVFCLRRHHVLPAALVVALATLNKESNLLLPVIFLPLFLLHKSRSAAIKLFSVLQLSAACAYIVVRYVASANAGGAALFQLSSNMAFWSDLRSYFLFFGLYNAVIPVPRGLNILTVSLVAILFCWNRQRDWIFWSLIMAAGVSLPLFLLFCYHDELRNLSFCFIPLYLMAVRSICALWEEPGPS